MKQEVFFRLKGGGTTETPLECDDLPSCLVAPISVREAPSVPSSAGPLENFPTAP